MASCVGNNLIKNYQNLIIGFQITVKNVGDVFFWDTVYISMWRNPVLFSYRKTTIRLTLRFSFYFTQAGWYRALNFLNDKDPVCRAAGGICAYYCT